MWTLYSEIILFSFFLHFAATQTKNTKYNLNLKITAFQDKPSNSFSSIDSN